MRRILRRIPSLLCLLLAVATVAVWVRSSLTSERYRWLRLYQGPSLTSYRSYAVNTAMGGLSIYYDMIDTSDPGFGQRLQWRVQRARERGRVGYATLPAAQYPAIGNDDSILQHLGFYFAADSQQDSYTLQRRVALVVPMWSILLLSLAWPFGRYVAGVLRRQREERLALGLCPTCGVALSAGMSRCPGCDRAVPPAAAAAQ